MIPKLKCCVWQRVGDDMAIMFQPHQVVTLADPQRQLEALLRLLREGSRPLDSLCRALAEQFPELGEPEVAEALHTLDGLGFLEDGAAKSPPGWETGRFDSNLEFFGHFSTLSLSRQELQRRIIDSHVLVLGTGGLGSTTVMNLAGPDPGHLQRGPAPVRGTARPARW
jgi:hypothetical protein